MEIKYKLVRSQQLLFFSVLCMSLSCEKESSADLTSGLTGSFVSAKVSEYKPYGSVVTTVNWRVEKASNNEIYIMHENVFERKPNPGMEAGLASYIGPGGDSRTNSAIEGVIITSPGEFTFDRQMKWSGLTQTRIQGKATILKDTLYLGLRRSDLGNNLIDTTNLIFVRKGF